MIIGTNHMEERAIFIERAAARARRWSGYADALLAAHREGGRQPRGLDVQMEALRHKRDTVLTKVAALRRHRESGWTRAQSELADAQRELRDAWRAVIRTLDREDCLT